jgi:hypothetical protein
MMRSESDELVDVIAKQRIDADSEALNSIAYKGRESILDFDRVTCIHDPQVKIKGRDRSVQFFCLCVSFNRIGSIDQQCNRLSLWNKFVQDF